MRRPWWYILDEHGEPQPCADALEWAEWMERSDRRIGFDVIPGSEIEVSTVFLGIDHNFSGGGLPLLWETMTFRHLPDLPDDNRESLDRWRWSTRAEALVGHRAIVATLSAEYVN